MKPDPTFWRMVDCQLADLRVKVSRLQELLSLNSKIYTLEKQLTTDLPPTVAAIVGIVCLSYELHPDLVASRARSRKVAEARQIVFYFCEGEGFNSSEIGRLFNRDHGTVIYAVRVINDRISIDPQFAALVASFKSQISNLKSVAA
jgi:chromosomal replication initiator protein